jgi:hypothetical protein
MILDIVAPNLLNERCHTYTPEVLARIFVDYDHTASQEWDKMSIHWRL